MQLQVMVVRVSCHVVGVSVSVKCTYMSCHVWSGCSCFRSRAHGSWWRCVINNNWSAVRQSEMARDGMTSDGGLHGARTHVACCDFVALMLSAAASYQAARRAWSCAKIGCSPPRPRQRGRSWSHLPPTQSHCCASSCRQPTSKGRASLMTTDCCLKARPPRPAANRCAAPTRCGSGYLHQTQTCAEPPSGAALCQPRCWPRQRKKSSARSRQRGA